MIQSRTARRSSIVVAIIRRFVAQAVDEEDARAGVIAHGADALDRCETGRVLAVCVLAPKLGATRGQGALKSLDWARTRY